MARQLHHFVPRFYLRRFIDEKQSEHELVWTYERDKEEPELRSLDHIAARNNYYTIDLGGGNKDQGIEKMFSVLEGEAASVLDKLAKGERHLCSGDRETFSMFLAFGWSRVPKFREEVEESAAVLMNQYTQALARDSESFAKSIAKFQGKTGTKIDDWEKLREAILEKKLEVIARPEFSLQIMLLNFHLLSDMILAMQWSFRETDSLDPLVTSDNPVVLNNPTMLEGAGPPTPLALEATFPISPELLFVATWDGHAGTGPMRARLARTINELMALAADKYVYTSAKIPAISKYLAQPRKRLIDPDVLQRIAREI